MTARTLGRRVRTTLVIVVAAYVIWLAAAVVRFNPPPAAAAAGGPPYEITGVYHVHTRFSDGHATPAEVAAAAAKRGLDFVILTDHGNPNRESLAAQGRRDGVLLLAGSELSVNRGHLVALDFATPPAGRTFPQNAEQAMVDVRAAGGFTVIAHPYSKTHWTWGKETAVSGIELADAVSAIQYNLPRFLAYAPALLVKPVLPLVATLSRPVPQLRKWDSLAAQRPVFAYFSADAHFNYQAIFGLFRVHVLLDEPPAADFDRARAQVFGALRHGRFYDAVDGAAPARGFGFWAESGGVRLPMGSRLTWSDGQEVKLVVRTPFPFAAETRLVRDGREIGRAAGSETIVMADRPGVYRVEVYLRARSPLAADFPWIVANPIFIERSRP
jgi:hypothetical protein